jgi:hypothetical protein
MFGQYAEDVMRKILPTARQSYVPVLYMLR